MPASSQSVLDLELDLDAFEGPFDLLLALVLRDEIELVEVQVAEICVAYLERLAEDESLDLEAASEFLVLVAALCELKARLLVPREEEDEELDPETAAEALAARLAEYARCRAAGEWLRRRRDEVGRRVFRDGPPPLAPRRPPPAEPRRESPERLRAALATLLEPPAPIELSHMPRRLLPVRAFLDRLRALLAERGTLTFDEAAGHLNRMGQAVAFWAMLELHRRGEALIAQEAPFATIRLARSSALRPVHRIDHHDDDLAALEQQEAVA